MERKRKSVIVILTLICNMFIQSLAVSNGLEFVKESVCDVDAKVLEGCSKMTSARGLFDCLLMCVGEDSCKGASLDEHGKCFLHSLCTTLETTCTGVDVRHNYWSKYCVCGYWDHVTESCQYVFGCWGDRCERYPTNCDALLPAGYAFGRYLMYIDPFQDGRSPLKVLCYIDPGSGYHNIKALYHDGGLNFNRTWKEYVDGFHMDYSNHWMGLKMWMILSTAGFTRGLVNLVFKGSTRKNIYRYYMNLIVSNISNNYHIDYSSAGTGSRGNIPGPYSVGNCFYLAKGIPFSTWDNDNDGDGASNCASQAGTGWWYSGCDNPCNNLGWGLDNWAVTPTPQRFSMLGVDMSTAHPHIDFLEIYITK